MPNFLTTEKPRQAHFKATYPQLSPAARADGLYKGHLYPFCLPHACAAENLYHGIRRAALAYFREQSIKWHDGHDGNPSNHLCDSQVCCVNFFYPFAARPEALAHLLRPVYPELAEMLPVEAGQYVAFEWIGEHNYLGEKLPRYGQRHRGALFTSADAAVRFRRRDGSCQMVLIEWKYTESYSSTDLRYARSGTDRTAIYRPLYEREDCPLRRDLLPDFAALFYEPFYQFMRQQLLAHEMERAHELGADVVTVLHIAPAANHGFQRVTSPTLRHLGSTATGVWSRLVRSRGRFLSVNTEGLFGPLSAEELPGLAGWLGYIEARYPWARVNGAKEPDERLRTRDPGLADSHPA